MALGLHCRSILVHQYEMLAEANQPILWQEISFVVGVGRTPAPSWPPAQKNASSYIGFSSSMMNMMEEEKKKKIIRDKKKGLCNQHRFLKQNICICLWTQITVCSTFNEFYTTQGAIWPFFDWPNFNLQIRDIIVPTNVCILQIRLNNIQSAKK